MISDLFDSPWKILILAVVILVLFGSRKLPDAARSLGKSMRILKTEISELHEDEPDSASIPAQPQITAHAQQVESLQRQLDELRNQSLVSDATNRA